MALIQPSDALDQLIPDIDPLNLQERIAWYEANLLIRPKEQPGEKRRSRNVPFVLNEQQKELEEYVVWCYRSGLPPRVIVLKARQEGISTWTEGHMYLQCLLLPEQLAFIVAHDEDATQNLRGMYIRYHDNMPDENRPRLDSDNRRGIQFQHNQSQIYCFTAGKGRGGGRSFNPTHLHASEVDYWPDPEKLYDAVSQGIADEPWTLIVFESTADGPHLMMNQMWNQAITGKSEFKPFFFGWHRHAAYKRSLSFPDLLKYGPDEWLMRNRTFVERCMKEAPSALEQHTSFRTGPGGDQAPGAAPEPPDSQGQPGPGGLQILPGSPFGGAPGVPEEDGREGVRGGGRASDPGAPFEFDLGRGTFRAGDDEPRDAGRDDGPGEVPRDGWREDDADAPRDLAGRGVGGAARRRAEWGDRETSGETGRNISNPVPAALARMGDVSGTLVGPGVLFADSLTPYEQSLRAEFDVSDEQLNWLRFIKANKCRRDEVTRRREYPSRPEEAFQASSSEVLDLRVLGSWLKEAETYPVMRCWILGYEEAATKKLAVKPVWDHPEGHIEVYEPPNPKREYLAALDTAQGVGEHDIDKLDDEGDWHVCIIMDLVTGNQVAEYRSKEDPDQMVDQVEYLCLWYKARVLAPETTGGYGVTPMRALLDRRTVPIYSRKKYNKLTRELTDTPGWDTNATTRSGMIGEMKLAVREDRCMLRSARTIREAMILEVSAAGKVQAPKNHHDDGPITWGICLVVRNELLGRMDIQAASDRKKNSTVERLNRAMEQRMGKAGTLGKMRLKSPIPVRIVRPRAGKHRPDGRRSPF